MADETELSEEEQEKIKVKREKADYKRRLRIAEKRVRTPAQQVAWDRANATEPQTPTRRGSN